MNAIREWMISLSSACIAAGLVRLAAGGKSKSSVINLISVLYILLSVLHPGSSATEFEWMPDQSASDASVQTVQPDLQSLALRQAEEQLEEEFAAECERRGFSAVLALTLTEENGECIPKQICIETDAASASQAKQLAEEWFGAQTIEIREEG